MEVITIVTVESLLKSKIWLGYGETNFIMKRGSFKYRENIKNKIEVLIGSPVILGDTMTALLFDIGQKEMGSLKITRYKERIKLHIYTNEKVWNRLWISFEADPKERIYGCGETFTKFNLRGEKVRCWVAEHQNSGRISKKIIREKFLGKNPNKIMKFSKYESYYAQPTFVSSEKYYVHVDTTAFTEFDFTSEKEHQIYIHDFPDIWFGNGTSFEEISKLLSEQLGRQPILPDWVYDGIILGVQGGTEIVEKKLKEAENEGIPVTGVWCQDWEGFRKTSFGYQLMWNWEWDKELYPNLNKKIKEWHKDKIHFLGYINPFLAVEKELYKYASRMGYCVKDKEGKDYMVKITTFPAAMVDFTNPDAYEWIKNIIKKNMIGLGLDGWMADFGEYLPTDSILYSGEDPMMVHNKWPSIWAKINREALEETGSLGKKFFFTRSGSTETIKYSTMMWNGDQHVDWSKDDGMPSVIPATLSLGMSGFSLVHSDAGGYTTIMHMKRTKELLMRWEELSAFSPLFRTHEGNKPDDNVQYDSDKELLAHMASMGRIHVKFSSYLKECAEDAAITGIPVIRPLFYHYDEEEAYEEMQEYLLGRDILVAPILEEGKRNREVFLPKDKWIHIFTGREYTGGRYKVEGPIGMPPVFIRKDSSYRNILLCNEK